jgi:hypothetical protein
MNAGSVAVFIGVIVVGLYMWGRLARDVDEVAAPTIPGFLKPVATVARRWTPLYWME